MRKIIKLIMRKLEKLRYVNRSIIFTLDLIISIIGTLFSFLLVTLVTGPKLDPNFTLLLLLYSGGISIVLFIISGLYKNIIRHSTLRELPLIFVLMTVKVLLLFVVITLNKKLLFPIEIVILFAVLDAAFSSFGLISLRSIIVSLYYGLLNTKENYEGNAFVYGDQNLCSAVFNSIGNTTSFPYKIKGYLTRNKKEFGLKLRGERVYIIPEKETDLKKLFYNSDVDFLIFPTKLDFNHEINSVVEFCVKNQIKMLILGELKRQDDSNLICDVKQIEVEDLLQRKEINIDIDIISEEIIGKTILVTGAAGSIGSEIARQVVKFNVNKLILLDNAETPLHNLYLEFTEKHTDLEIQYYLADVRVKDRIKGLFEKNNIDIVFHAAAYKHVPMIENNPCESILTNVWGSVNIAHYSAKHNVEKFIMISTDKAVNPTSVMGASKRIAEKCVQALNGKNVKTQFIVTRFGNVLGSNGSVIPFFKEQIAKGGPVTVTDPRMIRYFMTIPEACRLVLQASSMGKGGEIFLFDMGEQVLISDLAKRMISLSGLIPDVDIKIEYVGLRPGEKLYEEMLTCTESTLATTHEKIRVGHSEHIDIDALNYDIKELMKASKKIDINRTIKLMKKIVPEYKSNNSVFEAYDND